MFPQKKKTIKKFGFGLGMVSAALTGKKRKSSPAKDELDAGHHLNQPTPSVSRVKRAAKQVLPSKQVENDHEPQQLEDDHDHALVEKEERDDEVKKVPRDISYDTQFNAPAHEMEEYIKQLSDTRSSKKKPIAIALDHAIIQKATVYPSVRQLTDESFLMSLKETGKAAIAYSNMNDEHIKQRLHLPFEKLNGPIVKKTLGKKKANEQLSTAERERMTDSNDIPAISTVMTTLQQHLFTFMNHYQDMLYGCNTHLAKKSFKNADKEVRNTYCLHVLNHIYKVRDKILKNNAKLAAITSQKDHAAAALQETIDEDSFRDQGFTRPKVLILVPFRNNALEIIETLIQLSGTSQQENKKRFLNEFSLPSDEDTIASSKPDDYKKLFAGNIDDCFRIGIKFSRKQMKLFSEFYSSDVIVASPLGLKTIIGDEGDKKRDFDFLSSIELVIMDNAHVFLQQNWSHVQSIFKQMNLIPKESHGCDFSRVRHWYLDGRAKHARQTLIFSDYLTPELNSIFNSTVNLAGKVKLSRNWEGSLCHVLSQLPQLYQRLPPSSSVVEAADTRFKYFIERVLPTLRKSVTQQSHTLIVIPSYFDFVRIRNYLKDHNYNVGAISEYSSRSKVDHFRHLFALGELPFLMMTERYHFFRRHRLKGVKHIVFYGPPVNAHFYSELLNRMAEEASSLQDQGDESASATLSSLLLFDTYDALALERIVGTGRVHRLLTGEKDSHLFTS